MNEMCCLLSGGAISVCADDAFIQCDHTLPPLSPSSFLLLVKALLSIVKSVRIQGSRKRVFLWARLCSGVSVGLDKYVLFPPGGEKNSAHFSSNDVQSKRTNVLAAAAADLQLSSN